MSLDLVLGFTQALALTMSVAFVTYVFVIVIPYLRRKPAPVGEPSSLEWHFFVPCRDEEAVIGDTIRYLRTTFPIAHVWVIDDDSDDRTAGVVRTLKRNGGVRDPQIHLVQRQRPYARTGKGNALNDAYRTLKMWMGRRADADRAIVVVVDADGRPAPNCLEVCAAQHLFGNPRIGAVQVDVRMINAGQRQPGVSRWRRAFGAGLVRMQDLEFRTAIAAIQMSRGATGTISMGGNGQFTRLSALDSIAGPTGSPWRGSLLEDFELGVHLLTAGWHTGFSLDTHVNQEALYSLRRFLAQRTRWGQGTMQCMRYLRRIWDSDHLTTLGAAEMMYYLAQPWMQLLGTLIYPIPMAMMAYRFAVSPAEVVAWFFDGAWILFTVYGAFGLMPFVLWGPVYRARCEPVGFWKSVAYGFGYALYIYTFYITSWRALIRLVRGNNGWTKTRRNEERVAGKVALDV
ncbi:cellulose synthase/poly-beta-1,6-N-acetylglucosamine synthase-like glycosyltransferase [Lentzea flaviverrucosa]|uniref:Glycosyltransferase, catalytic subunit of cellulose synthase and poly-beta-1,6-N-acetylglucosamine synthase n=2 Tax=Lentzea flaviverrucosa TaxID=200379 RepID=A0A1H9VQ87_9PSEU|nr:cellulose synthase/poly-beta-1,6-N-acetylglucosamine synthase-like glycosyltransferase [Lentzea flaviverrucosa]SES23537.1 Glycosyltransferase, catalytic subunit of cellulose synthase and poly-beta-1,6-N-acetylglucosamine synthase [Lentzea flaviverrucosa]